MDQTHKEANDITPETMHPPIFISVNIAASLFAAVLCLCVTGQVKGQTPSLRFEHYGQEQGLSQASVRAISQDRMGFLWVGTQDGLNRFDGYQFRQYRQELGNPYSLPSNWVEALITDRLGRLWVGTNAGLSLYEQQSQHFVAIALKAEGLSGSGHHINTLVEGEAGDIWVGTRDGLVHLGSDLQPITRYLSSIDQVSTVIEVLFKAHDGQIWAGTRSRGLFMIEGDAPVKVTDEGLPETISSITEDSQDRLWLASEETGLVVYHPRQQGLHPQEAGNLERLISAPCLSLFRDKQDTIWVGTRKDLRRYQNSTDKFQKFKRDLSDPLSMSDNILCIYQDRHGSLWLGSQSSGLNRHNPQTALFGTYGHRTKDPYSLPDLDVRSFAEDANGQLWVAANATISRMDVASGRFMQLELSAGGERPEDHGSLRSLIFDVNGDLWASNFGGAFRYDQVRKQFTRYHHDPNNPSSLSSDTVGVALLRRNGKLILGTHSGGLNRFEQDSQSFSHYRAEADNPSSLSDDYVITLYEDSQEQLWVGTFSGGLNLLLPDGLSFKKFDTETHGLSHQGVVCVLEDHANRLWVGSLSGLNLWKPELGRFQVFGEEEGLVNSMIYALLEDKQGNIWMSTNSGLARLDPTTEKIRAYIPEDGLQGEEYNANGALKRANGMLVFGGLQGFNMFLGEQIPLKETPPKVVLTDFMLFNKKVPISTPERPTPLSRSIEGMQEMVLEHSDYIFSLHFSGLDYAMPQHIRYAYRLEGLNDEWLVTTASNRSVTYTNLSQGTYRFQVKATAGRGEWGPEEASLELQILPPYSQTWWAYSLYALAILALLAVYLAYQKRGRRVMEAQVADRTAQLNRQNEALDNRNRELEAVDNIVRAINDQIEPVSVMQVLTEMVHRLFIGAERVSCFLLDVRTDSFKIVASYGFENLQHRLVSFARPLLEKHYVLPTEEVMEGVRVDHNFNAKMEHKELPNIALPQSLISMTIVLSGKLAGYLVIDNLSEPEAFRSSDIQMLVRLRQHAISALSRSRQIRDLVAAQEQLADAAHAAGRAESAVDVLHNLGNTLNSVKIAVQLIRESAHQNEASNLLTRISAILADQQDLAQFLAEDPRGTKVSLALNRIAEKMKDQMGVFSEESEKLDHHLQQVTQTLLEQQRHTHSDTHLEVLDFNQLIHQALQNETYLFRAKGATIQLHLAEFAKVRADRGRLKRVLTYLLENAREAVSEGRGQLVIRSQLDGDFACLSISDNGIGIRRENLKKIYRDGYTTKPDRPGFGLHYSANTIKEMAGKIEIDSLGLGQGTCVSICLTLAK